MVMLALFTFCSSACSSAPTIKDLENGRTDQLLALLDDATPILRSTQICLSALMTLSSRVSEIDNWRVYARDCHNNQGAMSCVSKNLMAIERFYLNHKFKLAMSKMHDACALHEGVQRLLDGDM